MKGYSNQSEAFAVRPLACVAIAAAIVMAMGATSMLRPTVVIGDGATSLVETLPDAFGDWHEDKSPLSAVSLTEDEGDADARLANTYDQSLMRAYVDSRGDRVMVAIAYQRKQGQEGKIHRPELCYVAQGFSVQSLNPVSFPEVSAVVGSPVAGNRMLAAAPDRHEAVSYWIRVGNQYSDGAFATRWHILMEGLRGRVIDGALVRVSQIVSPQATSAELMRTYAIQERFAAELVQASGKAKSLLAS